MVTKVEKIIYIAQGVSLNAVIIGLQQRNLEQRNVQRLFREEVKPQAIGGRKG